MQNIFIIALAALGILTNLETAAFADGAKPAMTDDELTGKYCRNMCTEACAKKTPECARGYDKCTLICWGGEAGSVSLTERTTQKLSGGAQSCEQLGRELRLTQKECDLEHTKDVCDAADRLYDEYQRCIADRAKGTPPEANDVRGDKPVDGSGDSGGSSDSNALRSKRPVKKSGKVDTSRE